MAPSGGYDTAEYRNSNYAVAANAISAYEAGATGQGIKIGIVDTGINARLGEFAGKVDPASADVYGTRGVSDEAGHGTAVSAVAAAARNGFSTMGVAFDATIVSLRADTPGSCATADGCAFSQDAIADGVDAAWRAGAKVINLSLGGSEPGQTLLGAMQRAVAAGVVLVIAAGNSGADNPNPFALVPAQQFPGMVIIAGSIGADDGSGGTNLNAISTFSDRAGNGASFYLTALGYRSRAPDETGTNYLWSGTSFSAPTITGAVALMAQAFPNLTGSQIIEILFRSADDLGAAGVDVIFGHGRLNIASAFKPMGTTSLAGSQTPVSGQDNGDLPAAAGDSTAASSLGAIILDGYSRAFVIDLARTLHKAEASSPLSRSIGTGVRTSAASVGRFGLAMTLADRKDGAPDTLRSPRLVAAEVIAQLDRRTSSALGFGHSAKAMQRRLSGAESGTFMVARDVAGEPGFAVKPDTSLALRRNAGSLGFTISSEKGRVSNEVRTRAADSPYRWSSVSIDTGSMNSRLSVSLSRLEEKRTLLGGRMGSALGGGGSSSLFVDVEASRRLGSGFAASLTARRGWTNFATGKFTTDAYAAELSKDGLLNGSDRLALRLSQPLRISSGGFGMMLPTAYDYATETATSSWTSYSLSPSGREIDAEASYGRSIGSGSGWLGGHLFVRHQPGHVAARANDYGAAVRLSLGF